MCAMSRGAIFLTAFLAFLPYCLSQVTITNSLDTTSVRRSAYKNTMALLDIQASSTYGFICSLDTLDPTMDFFDIKKLSGESNFHIDFKPKTPTPVKIDTSIPEVELNGVCEDLLGENSTFRVIVYILPNESPVVILPAGKSYVEISDVPVETGQGEFVGKVEVTDPDTTDEQIFEQLTGDGFKIDAAGNIITTKHLAELDVSTIELTGTVDDGVNPPVQFKVIVRLRNLNLKPVDPGVITSISIPEDAPVGTEIYTMDVTDSTLFPALSVSLDVDPSSGLSLFKVDSGNKITTDGTFNFDVINQYNLSVTVSDGYKSSVYNILVNIQEGNDAPQCPDPTYIINLAESPTAEIDVDPFTIVDKSGDTHMLQIEPVALKLVVTSVSPLKIGFTAPFDCESTADFPDPLKFNLTVTDQLSATGYCTFNVICQDVNDEDPKFDPDTYIFNVSTDLSPGTKIGKVSATDADISKSDNGKITFSLDTELPVGVVEVKINGDVIIKESNLAQHYDQLVSGTVLATDMGSTPRTGSASFTLNWNKRPTFKDTPLQVSLSEDTNGLKLVLPLSATDPEGDPVTFIRNSVSDSAPFIVTETGGAYGIYYDGTQALSGLTNKEIDVEVQVEDGKGGNSVQTITVKLIPNALPDVACTAGVSTSVNVPDVKNGDTVYIIPVVDPNNDPISVSATCVPDPNLFIVNTANLTIEATTTMLDITVTTVDCTLTINDDKHDAADSQECVVRIVLTNPNDAPQFVNSDLTKVFGELTPVGTTLHSFDIIDHEPIYLTYTITDSSGLSYFTVDTTKHEVTLKSELDFETMPFKEFVVVVEATDTYLTSTATLTIEVIDENDPPKFSNNLYLATLKEGPASDNLVEFGLTATDTDGDTVTYQVVGPDSDKFIMRGTQLENIQELDLDADPTKNVYNIQVEASDGTGVTTADVTVTVELINDNKPEFEADAFSNCVVGLASAVSSSLCSGTATDADADGDDSTVTYRIGASSHPGVFGVINNDIVVTSPMPADQYGQLVYVEVIAEDKGTDPSSLSSAVNVTLSWNKPPRCQAPDELYIAENEVSPFTLPGSVITMDDGSDTEDDVVTGTLVCTPDDGLFKVDSTTKEVLYSSSTALSHNEKPEFTCKLTCSEDMGGIDEHDILIHVTKNRAPDPSSVCPVTITVDPKDHTSGSQKIGDLPLGVDIDPEDDPLTYSAGATPHFSVIEATGQIFVTDNLAKQTIGTVPILVTMTDPYDNTATCEIIITVSPLNEPPVVNPMDAVVTVDENVAPGLLTSFTFTDELTCDNAVSILEWDMDPPELKNDFIPTIPAASTIVEISNLKKLNHEERETYKFFITLTDGCQKTVVSRTERVLDVNEPPVFRSRTLIATFKENDTRTFKDLNCDGFDEDEEDEWNLRVSAGVYRDHFTVDGKNCRLIMIKDIDMDDPKMNVMDFETELTLEVEDKGGLVDTVTVSLTIMEVNEHEPLFKEPAYAKTFSDADPTELLDLLDQIEDLDNLQNGEFTCSPGDCDSRLNGFINIQSDCKVTRTRDMSTMFAGATYFRCQMKVTDKGNPALSSYTTLDLLYQPVTTPPPPPTTTPDPDADADADADASAGAGADAGAGGGSGIDQALNHLGSGSGTGALSPGAIAGMAVGALAAGALLATGLVFGISYCKNHCSKSSGPRGQGQRQYKVASRESTSKNRVTSSSSVRLGNMANGPHNGGTKIFVHA